MDLEFWVSQKHKIWGQDSISNESYYFILMSYWNKIITTGIWAGYGAQLINRTRMGNRTTRYCTMSARLLNLTNEFIAQPKEILCKMTEILTSWVHNQVVQQIEW